MVSLAITLWFFRDIVPYWRLLPLGNLLIHAILLVILMVLFLRCISRQSYHRATCLNCQLCVAMLYTPMLVQEPLLLIAELLSLMAIATLFLWYTDEKE